jgi:hypothetical protein
MNLTNNEFQQWYRSHGYESRTLDRVTNRFDFSDQQRKMNPNTRPKEKRMNGKELELDSVFGSERNQSNKLESNPNEPISDREEMNRTMNPNPKTKKSSDPLRIGNRRTRCGRLWPPHRQARWPSRGGDRRGAGPGRRCAAKKQPGAAVTPRVASGSGHRSQDRSTATSSA